MKLIALFFASMMLACQQVNARSTQMKLEELLQRLEQARPWTPTKIESALGVKPVLARANEYWSFYSAGPVTLEEGGVVEALEFGLKGSTQTIAGFTVHLSDDSSCMTRQRITNTYPDIQMDRQNIPRGHSLNEKIYYDTKRAWGELSFGFKERRPDCLSSIVFKLEGS
jgi:hypothetical protein